MDKDSGWGGQLGGGGKTGAEGTGQDKKKKQQKPKKAKSEVGGQQQGQGGAGGGAAPSPAKPHRFEPAKKDKRAAKLKKQEAKAAFNPASSANAITSLVDRSHSAAVASPEPSTSSTPKATRHAAPNYDEEDVAGASPANQPKQTAMQASLRAKLAGGKFRMLNETLYTSTGDQAWETMKEEGAFDDYHAGFRSQAAGWPVHPLTIISKSLSKSLSPNSLIADFGCGDAVLARTLSKSEGELKVISFDLVSKDGWVVEAECSSVPLPGGKQGGAIVDAVVCCLSLMGTDWVRMAREAWRVLKDGGEFKIAEVTSRFTDLSAFVALVESLGFELTHKDESNTHFVMLDFEKTGEEVATKRAETTKKAADLLKPCIYKKR
ncbi:methyltransferase-domain-containing protein [Leucosporidium creatinivorum]|uniref:Ribosomal RNA-processing protein 8 n=1 Tax=Leucosporidium creatinivorum TaxID=106004 RepID=A0A1Y2E192_9BASI|nr:methyltransferase-domain-containing protein [Leucosporidium creatinivorum]